MAKGAITRAIHASEGPAICAYVTGGFPDMSSFEGVIRSVANAADVVEVGVPFTDPMADGQTIQDASHVALQAGVTLEWILESLTGLELDAPVALMGYYNPFLAYGLDRLGPALERASVSALIVPDLPLEESGDLHEALEGRGCGVVQLVAPTTPRDRLSVLGASSQEFLYAVTLKGVTGGEGAFDSSTTSYLDDVKASTTLPVLAGFGIRNARQVADLAPHVDGVVVGSALIEAIERADDPEDFITGLRPTPIHS